MDKIIRDHVSLEAAFHSSFKSNIESKTIPTTNHKPKIIVGIIFRLLKPLVRHFAFRIRNYLTAPLRAELENINKNIQLLATASELKQLEFRINQIQKSQLEFLQTLSINTDHSQQIQQQFNNLQKSLQEITELISQQVIKS